MTRDVQYRLRIGTNFWATGLWFSVSVFGCRVLGVGLGFKAFGFWFLVFSFWFENLSFGFGVWSFGYGVIGMYFHGFLRSVNVHVCACVLLHMLREGDDA